MYFLVEWILQKLFFPHVINECHKRDSNIHSSSNCYIFRNALLKFIRPVERKIFSINDPLGIKMLTRLRLGFSHLRGHKFRHGFKDKLNPLCSCSIEAETTIHFFLRCHFYNSNRANLKNDLENISISLSMVSDSNLISLLLYGDGKFDDTKNRKVLMSTIRFIRYSQRFDEQLFWSFAVLLKVLFYNFKELVLYIILF